MRFLVLLSACVALLLAVPTHSTTMTEPEYQAAFTKYIKHYNKRYTAIDFHSHYSTFKHNLAVIDTHNQQANATFRMGINRFTDVELTEFAARYNGWRPTKADTNESLRVGVKAAVGTVPTSLDWRKKGAVTDVKDQGHTHTFSHSLADLLSPIIGC